MDHIYSMVEAKAVGTRALQDHGFLVVRGLISLPLAKRGATAIIDMVKEGLGAHGVFT